MKKTILIAVVAALVAGAGSFYGGLAYGKSQGQRLPAGQGQFQAFRNGQGGQLQFAQGGQAGRGQRGQNGGFFVSGDIMSKDAQSLTLKLRDGGSRIVLFSGSTKIEKFVDGTLDDLTNGLTVTVTGTANPDGSVTAQSIQIRPAGSGLFPGGQGGQQPPAGQPQP